MNTLEARIQARAEDALRKRIETATTDLKHFIRTNTATGKITTSGKETMIAQIESIESQVVVALLPHWTERAICDIADHAASQVFKEE